jgi:molecular chaperone GrpE
MEEEGKQENNKKNGMKKEEQPKKEEDELSAVKDRLLRLAAEFDNYKKKAAKDIEGAKGLGKAEFIKSLLPALDEFELALCALSNSGEEKSSAKGVELVFSNIKGTLKEAGLKEVAAKGKYDPYKHEIMMAKESKEPEGTIIEVVRKGYYFNEMLLRPSSVIVSKGNASKEEKQGE